jgi:hypothetical protein
MGIRAWHAGLLAILSAITLTAFATAADYSSARRTFGGPPMPPPEAELPAPTDPAEIIINPGYSPEFPDYYAVAPSCDVATYPATSSCNSACGGCDIPMNCCDCCPNWTLRGGAVFFRRENGTAIPIVTGTPSYSTADLDFGYQAGPAVSLIRHGFLGSCWDLELNYFGVFSDATATTADVDTVNSLPPIFVVGVVPGSTVYESHLHSTEFNLRRRWSDWLTVLGGFRWIELSDDLNTDLGAGLATFDTDVNNHLYGAQIGFDACLWQRGAFSVESFGKAGIYANNSDVAATTTGVGGALPFVSTTGSDTAFVGDLALTGVYALSNRWNLRGGYQLLWIDGVALAPNQLDNINIATGVATVDTSNTAFYHGFTAAAEYRF